MKCEFCGIKILKTERVCPNCGGMNSKYISSDDIDVILDNQENTLEELKHTNEKAKGKNKLIIILVIIIVVLMILPCVCCTSIIFSVEKAEKEETDKFISDMNNYYENEYGDIYYEDDEFIYNDDIKLEVDDIINFKINDKELQLPMRTGDFVEVLEMDIIDKFVINSEIDEYIHDNDHIYSLNVYNATDDILDYKDCELRGFRITSYPGLKSSDISFEFLGVTQDTTPDEIEEILGKPSSYYNSYGIINKEWDTQNGWFAFYWNENGEMTEFVVYNYKDFY